MESFGNASQRYFCRHDYYGQWIDQIRKILAASGVPRVNMNPMVIANTVHHYLGVRYAIKTYGSTFNVKQDKEYTGY